MAIDSTTELKLRKLQLSLKMGQASTSKYIKLELHCCKLIYIPIFGNPVWQFSYYILPWSCILFRKLDQMSDIVIVHMQMKNNEKKDFSYQHMNNILIHLKTYRINFKQSLVCYVLWSSSQHYWLFINNRELKLQDDIFWKKVHWKVA
jgi:hypothetical protein